MEPVCVRTNCADRVLLNPCDFENMLDYGNAVVCELNAQLNGCKSLLPAWHCTDIDICFNLIPPQSYLSLKPNTNPFLYCSEANCEPHVCPIGPSNLTLHVPLNEMAQDALINYARCVANSYTIKCPTLQRLIIRGIYFRLCYDLFPPSLGCFPNDPFLCHNMTMKLHVIYSCCGELD